MHRGILCASVLIAAAVSQDVVSLIQSTGDEYSDDYQADLDAQRLARAKMKRSQSEDRKKRAAMQAAHKREGAVATEQARKANLEKHMEKQKRRSAEEALAENNLEEALAALKDAKAFREKAKAIEAEEAEDQAEEQESEKEISLDRNLRERFATRRSKKLTHAEAVEAEKRALYVTSVPAHIAEVGAELKGEAPHDVQGCSGTFFMKYEDGFLPKSMQKTFFKENGGKPTYMNKNGCVLFFDQEAGRWVATGEDRNTEFSFVSTKEAPPCGAYSSETTDALLDVKCTNPPRPVEWVSELMEQTKGEYRSSRFCATADHDVRGKKMAYAQSKEPVMELVLNPAKLVNGEFGFVDEKGEELTTINLKNTWDTGYMVMPYDARGEGKDAHPAYKAYNEISLKFKEPQLLVLSIDGREVNSYPTADYVTAHARVALKANKECLQVRAQHARGLAPGQWLDEAMLKNL